MGRTIEAEPPVVSSMRSEAFRRRTPRQKRSRERVAAILDASLALIGQHGVDRVSMRDIAIAASVPISSLYQYFPNKTSIIATLIGESAQQYQAAITAAFAQIRGPQDLGSAVHQAIDRYFELFRINPTWLNLWYAMRADPELRSVEVTQATLDIQLVAGLVQTVLPNRSATQIERAVAFAIVMIGSVVPALQSTPDHISEQLVLELKHVVALRINDLIESS